MSKTMTWRDEQSSNFARDSIAPFESTLWDDRINALRELGLTLLREVEALQLEPRSHVDCSGGLQRLVERFEIDLIRQALHRCGGNQARAARLLGVKHTTLNAKIRRYKIPLIGQQNESENAVDQQVIAA
jgi:DNA-binding NtrC family response regulator